MTRISSAHHVLSVEHLLGEFRNGQGTVLLGTTGSERGEPGHEEVQTRKGDHVDSDLTQVTVQLTRETDAASGGGHSSRDQMVQVTVGGGGQLQGTEADIVEGFVVHHHNLISVLDELMERQDGVVRLDDGIGDLRRRDDGVSAHDTIWVFLTDLGDQERSHTGSSTTT